VAVAIGVATVIGMAVLWPGDVNAQLGEAIVADSERATVQRVE